MASILMATLSNAPVPSNTEVPRSAVACNAPMPDNVSQMRILHSYTFKSIYLKYLRKKFERKYKEGYDFPDPVYRQWL